jgi:transposase InsO family protein
MYFFAKKHAEKYPLPFKIGRKAFEKTLLDNGFRLIKKRVFHKTTRRGAFIWPNLIAGTGLWELNMVWVSDITYFEIWSNGTKTFFYLTLILDVYSRKCIGWHVSKNLQTENTSLPALQIALKNRNIKPRQSCWGLILHSDGGGQYSDKAFMEQLKHHHIQSSMANVVYENPFIERFHSTLKNDYLFPWQPNSFNLLLELTRQAVYQYNFERPHSKLDRKTPDEFEQNLAKLPLCQRTFLTIKVVDQ